MRRDHSFFFFAGGVGREITQVVNEVREVRGKITNRPFLDRQAPERGMLKYVK